MDNADVTLKDVDNLKTILNHLKMMSEFGIDSSMEQYFLRMLDIAVNFQSYLIHTAKFPEIHRLTINKKILGANKRIHKISFLKYPPNELVKSYGRCNLPKQSVLYASHGGLMIYSEMRPEVGDLVTMSTWKTKNDDTLTFCPIFKNQPPNNTLNLNTHYYNSEFNKMISKFPPNQLKLVDELTQFIADAFSKRFKHNSNDSNYLISAYFSDIMLNKYQDNDIDAILYPSVQQSLAFENLAIKPEAFDLKYSLVEVDESIVVQTPKDGKGGYFSEGINNSKDFELDNDIIRWGESNRTEEEMEIYKLNGYDFN